MKRLFAMLLAIALILTLAACGKTAAGTEDTSAETTAAETTAETTEAAETTAETTTEAATEAEETQSGNFDGDQISYFYNYLEESKEYKSESGTTYQVTVQVPMFNVDADDAYRLNGKIEATYETLYDELEATMKTGSDLDLMSITSETYHNGDILSIVIQSEYNDDTILYDAYNLNVATGKEADGTELIALKGMDEATFRAKVETLVGDTFVKTYGENTANDEYYEEQYNKTISADEFGVDMPMFLNGDGELNIVAKIYSLAGADYYFSILTVA